MAKQSRVSKKLVSNITADKFGDAVGAYATAYAEGNRIAAKMELEITRIREKYSNIIVNYNEAKEQARHIIETYCLEQKEALFAGRRTMNVVHGTVGFRLGTPKLKTLKGYTWDRVLEKLETVMPDFIRIKKEVAKDELLANRHAEQVAPHLVDIGVWVDQEESFFIEMKEEETLAAC